MGPVEIVEYDPSWPDAFRDIAGTLRETLGASALRIDHIGSTSVVGLASKDIIDIQVSVAQDADLNGVASERAAGVECYRAPEKDGPLPWGGSA